MWGASATYFLAKDTVQFLKKEKGISFIFFYYSVLQWEHSGTWIWNFEYTEGAVKCRYSLWAFSLFSQVESIQEMIIGNILLLINDFKPFECTRINTILCPEIQFIFSKQNFAFLFDQLFHVFCQMYANLTALNSNMKMALWTFYNKF